MNITSAERYSVQQQPEPNGNGPSSEFWSFSTQRGYVLPEWGTRARERELRSVFYNPYNWLGQSAFAGLLKKLIACPWKISGGREYAYFQDVLANADFGRGWGSFASKLALDYLRQDGGGWFEIIAPGSALREPSARVVGIAPLDSLRITPTGNPDWPALYTDDESKLHQLHRSRVAQLVDMPDSNVRRPGYGLSAQSRAISIIRRSILQDYYVESKLDDKPPPGFAIATNLTKPKFDQMWAQFRQEQSTDEKPEWGRTVWLYSIDPEKPAKLEYITFAQSPENWNFKEYTEINVHAFAVALGVDIQELWELTGGNIGSAGQSEVQHAKSQGRTFGALLKAIERIINYWVLPPHLKFEFDYRDPYEADQRATVAQKWAGVNLSVAATLSPDEQRRFLAATIEEYRNIVTDPDGKVLSLTDADPEEQTQTQDDLGGVPGQVGTATQTDAAPAEKDYPNLDMLITPISASARVPAWQKLRNGVAGAFGLASKQSKDKGEYGMNAQQIEQLRQQIARNKAAVAEFRALVGWKEATDPAAGEAVKPAAAAPRDEFWFGREVNPEYGQMMTAVKLRGLMSGEQIARMVDRVGVDATVEHMKSLMESYKPDPFFGTNTADW